MEQAPSTQTCIFPICKCTKMDWMFSPKKEEGPKQSKQDRVYQYGPNRTVADQIGPNKNEWTDQDQCGCNGSN